MRLSELMTKDIINDDNGVKLGKITDIEFNENDGNITSIVINKAFKLNNIFQKENELVILWDKIIKIGTDVIIVDYPKIKNKNK